MSVTQKAPIKFWVISVVGLVWNLIGVMQYFVHVSLTEEDLAAMPEAQRALMENLPAWLTGAFAIAVFAGALGCLILLLRKSLAIPVLVLSLAAATLQMGYNLFMTKAIEVMGVGAIMPAVLIIGIGSLMVWFGFFSKGKGWIS